MPLLPVVLAAALPEAVVALTPLATALPAGRVATAALPEAVVLDAVVGAARAVGAAALAATELAGRVAAAAVVGAAVVGAAVVGVAAFGVSVAVLLPPHAARIALVAIPPANARNRRRLSVTRSVSTRTSGIFCTHTLFKTSLLGIRARHDERVSNKTFARPARFLHYCTRVYRIIGAYVPRTRAIRVDVNSLQYARYAGAPPRTNRISVRTNACKMACRKGVPGRPVAPFRDRPGGMAMAGSWQQCACVARRTQASLRKAWSCHARVKLRCAAARHSPPSGCSVQFKRRRVEGRRSGVATLCRR